MNDAKYTRSKLLTTPEETKTKLRSPHLCLIDTRPAEQFAQGHIAGAVHFDLFGLSLVDTRPDPLKAFLIMIHHLFEMRGVGVEKEVIFYEEVSGMRAARGLWFLEYFGHPSVCVLDGGIRAWSQRGYPATTDVNPPKTTQFKTAEKRNLLATADDVLQSLGKDDVNILDTRSDDEFSGTKIRAARGGVIPGAIHIEWTQNLNQEGRYKSPSDLKAMYESAGIVPEHEVIPYCQGGYRSAQSYLALKLAGFPKVRNYIGSWREWGDRLDLPIKRPREKE